MTTIKVPVPWSTVQSALVAELTKKLQESDAFVHNKFGEFNYGAVNNDKCLNTTIYLNGGASSELNPNGQITIKFPCKVEGDHKVWMLFGGWKDDGRVTCATFTLKITLTLTINGLPGPLKSISFGVNAQAEVQDFHNNISKPLGGITAALGFITGAFAGPLVGAIVGLGLDAIIKKIFDDLIEKAKNPNIPPQSKAFSIPDEVLKSLPKEIAEFNITNCTLEYTSDQIILNLTF